MVVTNTLTPYLERLEATIATELKMSAICFHMNSIDLVQQSADIPVSGKSLWLPSVLQVVANGPPPIIPVTSIGKYIRGTELFIY